MAKVNFGAVPATQTAKSTPRGLDYFLYGPQLKAQTNAAAMKVAGQIESDTAGVHQKDLQTLGMEAERVTGEKGTFMDKLLDGKDVNAQDVKSIANTFNRSKALNKKILFAKANTERINKAKQLTMEAGVASGDMTYYDQWYKDSVKGWQGSFNPDGSTNFFELSTDVADYVDIEKNYRKDMEIARQDMRDTGTEPPSYTMWWEEHKDGKQLMFKMTGEETTSDNSSAVANVLEDYTNRINDRTTREGKFLEYRTRDDQDYYDDLLGRLSDVTDYSQRENITGGKSSISKGRFLENKTTDVEDTGTITMKPIVEDRGVNTPTESVPGYTPFSTDIGGTAVVQNDYSSDPSKVQEMVVLKPGEGVTESNMTDKFDDHTRNTSIMYDSATGGVTTVGGLKSLLSGSSENGTAMSDYLTDPNNKSAQRTRKELSNKIDELSEYTNDVQFNRNDYETSLLDNAKTLNRRKRTKMPADIEKRRKVLELKNDIAEIIGKANKAASSKKIVPARTHPLSFTEKAEEAYKTELGERLPEGKMVILGYDDDTDRYSSVASTYNDKNEVQYRNEKITARLFQNMVSEALILAGSGSKQATGRGVKVTPGASVTDASNPTDKWLPPGITQTPESMNNWANAHMITVEVYDKDGEGVTNTYKVAIENTGDIPGTTQPSINKSNTYMVESKDGLSDKTPGLAVRELKPGEEVTLYPGNLAQAIGVERNDVGDVIGPSRKYSQMVNYKIKKIDQTTYEITLNKGGKITKERYENMKEVTEALDKIGENATAFTNFIDIDEQSN